MNGGVKTALLISCMGLGGCAAKVASVEVRPIANPSAALSRGGDAVAIARGQLLIGNVGLALEGFRKAQRENPTNPAALAGIGDCYAAMSRFDLAQSNYESALALAPHDRTLLLGLAAVFERGGQRLRAIAARAEANAAVQPAPAVANVVAAAPRPAPVPAKAPSAIAARPAPAPRLLPRTLAQPAPVAIDARAGISQLAPLAAATMPKFAQLAPPVVPVVVKVTQVTPPVAPVVAKVVPPRAEPEVKIPAPSIGSITVELPAARPAPRLKGQAPVLAESQRDYDEQVPAATVTVALPPAPPAPAPKPKPGTDFAPATLQATAPRLERLTSGEVALVTTGRPLWNKPQNVLAAASSVRWVALAQPGARPNIQILNAARSQGLAASARAVLHDRGWRKLAIGDAPAIQAKSEVLYPKGREKLGKRLAAQFGVAARAVERDVLILVLGRDAVVRVAGPRKS